MGLRINTNVSSLNAQRNLGVTKLAQSKVLEQLSSGSRINRAGDDAAGLAISENLKAQIRGLGQAERNAQDGISLIQTAEGALTETHSILQRMRELVIQAGNDTYTTTDKAQIASEVTQLTSEIDRIASTTQFNTKTLLNGSATSVVLQIGANSGQILSFKIGTMSSGGVGGLTVAAANVSMATAAQVSASLVNIDNAITAVASNRSNMGEIQNRLEYTISNLSGASENLTAAESRIRDVDMAAEMMSFTKNNILTQAAQAMLAQANQLPQGILQLLG